jgi:hypothetical protein
VTQVLAEVFSQDPPRFMARTPHGYNDANLIQAELCEAGFTVEHITPRADTSRAASARDPAVAYCQGTPLRNEIDARDASRLEEVTDLSAAEIARRFGSCAVAGRIAALIVTARR